MWKGDKVPLRKTSFLGRETRYKPGLIGVQYAFDGTDGTGGFNTFKNNIRQYLEEKRKHPGSTDLRYLCRIMFNIIFKGLRSS